MPNSAARLQNATALNTVLNTGLDVLFYWYLYFHPQDVQFEQGMQAYNRSISRLYVLCQKEEGCILGEQFC